MTAPALVYMFCFITCAICAGLLVRSWFKTRTRLLLWIAVSFVCLAVNNFFLFADTTLDAPGDRSQRLSGRSRRSWRCRSSSSASSGRPNDAASGVLCGLYRGGVPRLRAVLPALLAQDERRACSWPLQSRSRCCRRSNSSSTFLGLAEEDRSWIYLLRLAAFLIVIFAILRKNMQKR